VSALTVAGQALRRASRWRLVLLFVGFTTVPALLGALPLGLALEVPLAHSAQGRLWASELDFETWIDALRVMGERGLFTMAGVGLVLGLLMALLVAPWLAGATLAEVRADRRLKGRELLQGAGEYWGRLTRLGFLGLVPFGVAAAASAGLWKLTDTKVKHEVAETAAKHLQTWASLGVAVLVVVALLTVDAGRAVLGARPGRRSAFLAWTSGTWLMLRKPLQTGAAGVFGLGVGLAAALLVTAARGRLSPGALPLSLGLSTLAAAAVGWGRAVRLGALTAIASADATVREARKAAKLAAKAAAKAPPPPPAPLEPSVPIAPEAAPPPPAAQDGSEV
jgi:hypothetical protein